MGRAFKATKTLASACSDLEQDVSFIQEPYSLKNKIIGFPLRTKIIQYPENPKVAIIIHNDKITVFPIIIQQKIIITKLFWNSIETTVINCYLPPQGNIMPEILEIEKFLASTNEAANVLIVGDFNAKNELWGGNLTDKRGEEIFEFYSRHDLFMVNSSKSLPTFETANGRSWIDLTISSQSLYSQIKGWEVLEYNSDSDHRYIKIELFNVQAKKEKRLTAMGEIRVLKALEGDEWLLRKAEEDIRGSSQLEHILEQFYYKIDQLVKKFSKNVTSKGKEKPWWNPNLEIQRKKVRALRRRFQRCGSDLRDQFKKDYLAGLKDFQTNLEDAKTNSWKEYCGKHKSNPFAIPYKIAANKIKKSIIFQSMIQEDGETTKTREDTIRYILENLYEVATEDAEPSTGRQLHEQTPNTTSEIIKFTTGEVDHVVNNLRKNISPGPDKIKTPFIQTLYKIHKKFFLNIFNAAARLRYFPSRWKISKVVLIPKNKSQQSQDPQNFRPIAINSIFGKIFEKVLYHRYYYYFSINKLFPNNQFGFTYGKSAILALHNLKNNIVDTIQKKDNVVVISLDIKNAFGSINYDSVTNILIDLKVPHDIIKMIGHMLIDRRIIYEQEQNIEVKLAKGAPQGSPLSPFLWNLIISDLLTKEMPENTSIQAFADDVTLVVRGKSRIKIEREAAQALQIVENWSKNHGLRFSHHKCQFINIGKEYKNRSPVIKLGAHSIKRVQAMKILGVVFDNKLSFLPHLKEIKQKVTNITSGLAQFSGTDWGITPQQIRQIYTQSIERTIVYGSPIWYPPVHERNKKNIEKINKLKSIQRIPLMKIAKAFQTVSNDALNIICNIPPVHLTIEKENELFNILHSTRKIRVGEEQFGKDDIANKVDLSTIHPAKRKGYDYTKKIGIADYSFYTDGSEQEGGCGAAYVVQDRAGRTIKYRQIKLPVYSNNFEAETAAILEALIEIQTMNPNKHYQIITDSLSTLQALKNPNNANFFVHKIRVKLNEMENIKITLVYTKAHAGTQGNELADQLAKEAIREGLPYTTPISKSFVKKQLYKGSLEQWNTHWNTVGKQSYIYQWIKNIRHIPTFFPPGYWTTQAVTAHGRFPFYFHRFKITEGDKCPCGDDATSFDHYLDSCKLTENERRTLTKKFKNPSKSKPEIIKDKTLTGTIEQIVRLINDRVLQA